MKPIGRFTRKELAIAGEIEDSFAKRLEEKPDELGTIASIREVVSAAEQAGVDEEVIERGVREGLARLHAVFSADGKPSPEVLKCYCS